jgi:hypothetical protein
MSSCAGSPPATLETAPLRLDAAFTIGADVFPPFTVFRPIIFMSDHIRPASGAPQEIHREMCVDARC